MTKLEELKNLVAQAFEEAEDKKQIEQLANINNTIDQVEQEQKDLEDRNTDLLKSYKELVKHTSIKSDDTPIQTIDGSQAPDFDSMLAQYLNK